MKCNWDHFPWATYGCRTASENDFFVLGKVRKGPREIYSSGQGSLLYKESHLIQLSNKTNRKQVYSLSNVLHKVSYQSKTINRNHLSPTFRSLNNRTSCFPR